MKVLISGASGFVGHALIQACEMQDSLSILGLDRNIDKCIDLKNGKILRCDLNHLQSSVYAEALVGFEGIVVHLAAARTDDASAGEYFRDNVQATSEFLKVLDPKLIKKFIHISSVAAIDGQNLFESDVLSSKNSDDLYRYTKYKQQLIIEEWCSKNCVQLIIIAPSAIYDDSRRDDTNIGRLRKYLKHMPIMPCIDTKKSLTSMNSLILAIRQQIFMCQTTNNIKKYILIDNPVKTVSQIMQSHSYNKTYLIRVPYLKLILNISAWVIEGAGIENKLPLTKLRVEKLFKDTSYKDQDMFEKYPEKPALHWEF